MKIADLNADQIARAADDLIAELRAEPITVIAAEPQFSLDEIARPIDKNTRVRWTGD